MAYKAPKEKLEILSKAAVEYRASDKSISELEKEHGLPKESLRKYINKAGLIKDEHKYAKTKLKDKIVEAEVIASELKKSVAESKQALPAEIVDGAEAVVYDIVENSNKLKRLMIENAIKINDELKKILTNSPDVYALKEASLTLKNLNDTAGLFPKAPMIAVQNNVNTISGAGNAESIKKEKTLDVKISFVGAGDKT